MTPQLEAILKTLPDRPGVYLMKDARGTVLYVGKAQSLRSRVRSYWQKEAPGLEPHLIRSVIDRVDDLEYTMTDSVGEALLLEGNLVKRFQPPFNVRLKDDKSYPYIKITLTDDFPRIERTRKLPNDGSRYFGPYASASSVDEAMNLVRRLFPFRTCTIDIKDGVRALQRPCLLYHIKRCQGPCIEAISKDAYRADIDQVGLFLEGRQESLVKALRDDMRRASEREDYEHAAIDRDKIKAIERTMESQKMAAFARTDLDLLGLARRDNQAAVQLFVIRGGDRHVAAGDSSIVRCCRAHGLRTINGRSVADFRITCRSIGPFPTRTLFAQDVAPFCEQADSIWVCPELPPDQTISFAFNYLPPRYQPDESNYVVLLDGNQCTIALTLADMSWIPIVAERHLGVANVLHFDGHVDNEIVLNPQDTAAALAAAGVGGTGGGTSGTGNAGDGSTGGGTSTSGSGGTSSSGSGGDSSSSGGNGGGGQLGLCKCGVSCQCTPGNCPCQHVQVSF